MKKPQWITIIAAIFLIAFIFLFARTTPLKKISLAGQTQSVDAINLTDTILSLAKRQVKPSQLEWLTRLENSIVRGAVKEQQLNVYHQLAHFWGDSAGFFLPYAWYEAEAARLENSEKTLTFAARLFLDNLQGEQNPDFRRWEALQAKDLFERSLSINPSNDSAKIGIGACYIFGDISAAPMEGIAKIREVLNRDSTNTYALIMMAKGARRSQQNDKAIDYLISVNRLEPANREAVLMLADTYERKGDKVNAIKWYRRTLQFDLPAEMKTAIEKRIDALKN